MRVTSLRLNFYCFPISQTVIAEMIELLSEEDSISEVVAPEPDSEPVAASIVSSYNTSAGSSQAAWSGGVALVAAMAGILFF